MKLRITCVLFAIMLVFGMTFVSCNEKESQESNEQQTTEKYIPTKEELDSMYDEAQTFEANGKFLSAIKIYRKLNEYGFADPDFTNNSLEIRENRYLHQKIICKYYEYAVDSLRDQLKDPNSLTVYQMSVDHKSPSGKITVIFDYGAKNSFGGMVRDTYTKTYSLSSDEKTSVYEGSKSHMDSLDLTAEDAGRYLSGNSHMHKQSQYDAIVSGNCDY